jgi:hypothetical protein
MVNERYDYAFHSHTIDIDDPSTYEKFDDEDRKELLSSLFGEIALNITRDFNAEEPPWEAISHDTTNFGNVLVVTFLLRRPQ